MTETIASWNLGVEKVAYAPTTGKMQNQSIRVGRWMQGASNFSCINADRSLFSYSPPYVLQTQICRVGASGDRPPSPMLLQAGLHSSGVFLLSAMRCSQLLTVLDNQVPTSNRRTPSTKHGRGMWNSLLLPVPESKARCRADRAAPAAAPPPRCHPHSKSVGDAARSFCAEDPASSTPISATRFHLLPQQVALGSKWQEADHSVRRMFGLKLFSPVGIFGWDIMGTRRIEESLFAAGHAGEELANVNGRKGQRHETGGGTDWKVQERPDFSGRCRASTMIANTRLALFFSFPALPIPLTAANLALHSEAVAGDEYEDKLPLIMNYVRQQVGNVQVAKQNLVHRSIQPPATKPTIVDADSSPPTTALRRGTELREEEVDIVMDRPIKKRRSIVEGMKGRPESDNPRDAGDGQGRRISKGSTKRKASPVVIASSDGSCEDKDKVSEDGSYILPGTHRASKTDPAKSVYPIFDLSRHAKKSSPIAPPKSKRAKRSSPSSPIACKAAPSDAVSAEVRPGANHRKATGPAVGLKGGCAAGTGSGKEEKGKDRIREKRDDKKEKPGRKDAARDGKGKEKKGKESSGRGQKSAWNARLATQVMESTIEKGAWKWNTRSHR
ncbi:hypothetical protein BDK51DRAFT_49259 [Blyttiomyces helicus]|uniref:Uncharacterized protein n=1 Tax=Blyttiomyces helicus TaxID=388810 RepID=A0A4P9VZN8_9FUNG|nr:hypothetical protein BDK51DRAFT_49259 [Blyttiomyces helicus]|eukprot:RKO84263.1 hypothetical protein BDK51DRAFT_49259 [Blyttiomyces helicus]